MPEYIGYHGTDNEAAEKIIEQQKFLPSQHLDEWLGKGVYFFNRYDDAEWWCKSKKHLAKDCYTILKVVLIPEKVVNLFDDFEALGRFKEFCEEVKNQCAKLPNGRRRANYMSLAIGLFLKKSQERIDMIIGGFNENRNFWYNKQETEAVRKFPIVISPQIQYCVLNSKCIKSITSCQGV